MAEDVVDKELDIVLVVITAAILVKRHVHGEVVLKDLKVVIGKRLNALEAELDEMPKVDVAAEMLLLGDLQDEVFDVVGLGDTLEVENDVGVSRGVVVMFLTTSATFWR